MLETGSESHRYGQRHSKLVLISLPCGESKYCSSPHPPTPQMHVPRSQMALLHAELAVIDIDHTLKGDLCRVWPIDVKKKRNYATETGAAWHHNSQRTV